MDDLEFDSIISKLKNELLNEYKEADIKEILMSYNNVDWENWLQDILNLGIAYPVSKVSSDGDVIIDIIGYLRSNNISTKYYERAITDILTEEYHQNPEGINTQERLINALISLSSTNANEILLNILFSRINSHKKGRDSYIKTLALIALTQSPNLNDNQKTSVFNFIVLQGFKEMKHDPYFYSNSLRFCYLKISVKSFYELLTLLIHELDSFEDKKIKKSIIYLIVDKIEDLHFTHLQIFFSSLFKWFIKTQNPVYSNSLNNNECNLLILKQVASLLKSDILNIPLIKGGIIDENLYKDSLEFFLSILLDDDITSKQLLDEPLELLQLLKFITKKTDYCSVLVNLIKQHENFVMSTKMRLIPLLIEDLENPVTNLLDVSKILDEISYSTESSMESSKRSISKYLNPA